MDLIERTATEHLDAMRRGELTSEALTTAYINAIVQREPKVKAFLHVDDASALEQA